MYLKRLVLHKFKRFFLSGVEHFEYIPNSNVTVIAWGNGLGKSSLLSQLHPLPADLKKDYREDGYKYLEFSIGDDNYIASSGYVGKNKHSFIKNDIELNTAGTGNVQKQLVEEHLKLNQNIFSILLGTELFTLMSPSTRKYWFSLLSPVDYTFPVKVWNNLRSRSRDILGSIKIFQDDLIKKTKNITDKTILEDMKKCSLEIETTISNLSNAIINMNINNNHIEIEKVLEKYDKNKIDIQNLRDKLHNIKNTELDLRRGSIEAELKNVDELLKIKAKLVTALDHDTLHKLEEELKHLSKLIEDNKKHIPKDVHIGSSNLLSKTLESVRERSRVYLNYLLDPEVISLGTRKDLLEYESKMNRITLAINQLNGNLTIYKNQLAELSNTSSHAVTCPNCNHTWHYNNQEQYNKVKYNIDVTTKRLKAGNDKLQEIQVIYNKILKKIEYLDKLISIVNDPILKPLYVYDEHTSLESIPSLLNTASSTIETLFQLEEYITLYDNYKRQYDIQLEAKKVAEQLGVSSVESIEKDILDLTTKKQNLLLELDHIKKLTTYVNQNYQYELEISNWYNYKQQEKKYLITQKHNEYIRSLIGELKLKLSILQKDITESNMVEAIIKDLQLSIDKYKYKLNVVQQMVNILSPESGLIAKSINSFLNGYLSEMNNIINSVWSYNMELLPCEVDDNNDLNYKFKVKVNHDEIIDDISKLSSSMQEIVNLAFKIVFVKYLGLANYPLILDEFGRTMDAEHRVASYDVIDRVLSHNFQQIILVSHYESMYSRFVNADFLELKEYIDNLTHKE